MNVLPRHFFAPPLRRGALVCGLGLIAFAFVSCRRTAPTVAVIPRTCGTALWEPEHAGAAMVARSVGLNLYWNAPMRDDDIRTQISLIEKSVERGMAGIIVSPIQTLPLRTPIRRVIAKGIPVVVIDTELGIPSGPHLNYVLNDEETGGRIAARRIGSILHGQGKIAIVGIQPELKSNTIRERSLESTLNREFPGIHVLIRRLGLSSVPQEQHSAEELLSGSTSLDAIVALSLAATRGTYYALAEFSKAGEIKLVGFDQDLIPPIRDGGIDSVVVQNTYELGRAAMETMNRQMHGSPSPAQLKIQPVLMTRENIDSAAIRQIENMSWWAPQ
ncbi:MAG: substrate-binding domain-containing protein [Acidobacteria bacterium]|nr:substrate-binding domain-containing protein [Acidobacteriota bacterium]